MNKNDISKALEALSSQKIDRKFNQTYDLIVNLQDMNLKNPEDQVDFFLTLTHTTGRKRKICALTGPELQDQAKKVCDHAISQDEFLNYADKKKSKKLAEEYDYFIAQANIMPKVAASFGRTFGPRGKMPNPKAGCVVPGNANLKPLYDRLQKTLKIQAKKELSIKVGVGKEDMKKDDVVDNIFTVYNQIIHHLPREQHNVKNIMVKLTMSKPIRI
ncbi:hypothetical protein JW868_04070 [Candidatus Woesearchaeota archaeon]|nr:hypothetical protein [Candidatus Woesearchaeota archaeon]